MTTYIDFPEKIRSTRADGKLVDGPAIDGLILDAQFPDGIMRDTEFNAASVRMMLGLSAQEVTDILTGLVVANGAITITQNDGTSTPFTLPAGTPDGVIASGAFSADLTELVITLDDGTMVPIDVPPALRLGQGSVNSDFTLTGDGSSGSILSVVALAFAGGLPQPTAAYLGRFVVDLATLVVSVGVNRPSSTSVAVGDFERVSRADLLLTNAARLADWPDPVLDFYLYTTFYDRFYVGTTLAPGRVEWFTDTPTNALDASRSDPSFAVHWLGRHPNAAAAAAAISTLADDTDYFYHDDGLTDIRRLDRDSFVAAGGLIDHFGWAAIQTDSIRPVVIDGSVSIPRPSEEYAFQLLFNPSTEQLDICLNHPHTQGETAGTWDFIPDRDDLYIEESRAFVSDPMVDDFAWDAGADHFYQYAVIFDSGNFTDDWVQTTPDAALAGSRTADTNRVIWLGEKDSDVDALAEITALIPNADYFYNVADTIRRLDTATYVAPGAVVDHWEWTPTAAITWDDLRNLVDAQPSAREKEQGTSATPRPLSVKDVADVVSGQGALSQLFEKEQEVALHSDDEFLVRTSTQRVHLPVRAGALDVLNVPRGGQAVFFLARTADYLYTHHLTAGDDQVERYDIDGDGTPLTNGLAASIDGARNQVYQGSDARAGFDVDPSTSEFMTIGRRDPNGAVNPTVYKWAYADEEVAQVYVDADRTTVIPNGNLDAGNPSPYAMAMATLEADDATGLAAGQYCLLTDNGATSKGMVFVYRSADGVAAATHLKTIDFSGDVDTTFFNPVVALAVKLIGTRLIMFASAAVSSLGRRLLAYDVNTGDRVTEAEIGYGSDVWFGVTIGADGILYGTVEQPTSFPAYRAYSVVESGSVARAKHGDPAPFRTTIRAKPAAAAKIGRIVRHYTLDTSLLLMNSDDDVELVLETGGATGSSLNLNFVTSVRIAVGLLRTRTPSTLTDGLILTNANNDFVAADADKYIPIKIDRGNANDAWDFGHETLWVGRVDNTTLCVWVGNLVPATMAGWAFVTVNRLQYGGGGVGAPASAAQQLVDGGTIGGYYFGVFYQQAANQPAFNGLPGETGSWSGLGDWKVSRATAVDATSTDPVWIAYASGFIDDFNVTYPNSPSSIR